MWGSRCECGDWQLVHRGPAHDGMCLAVRCAKAIDRGWVLASRCEVFRATEPDVPTGAQPMTSEDQRQADTDAPYERVREYES